MRPVGIRNRHPRLRLLRPTLHRALAVLDAEAERFRGGCPPGELSLVFLGDRALARLHAAFLDDPAPTDVITFPGDPAAGIAGEICISADAAVRQLGSRGRRAPAGLGGELTLYLVHGWLHLAGYEDLVPAKKRAMRRAEARALRLLRAARALPRFGWRG